MNKFKDTRIYGQLIVDDSIIMDKAIVNSQMELPYTPNDHVLKFKGLNYEALIRNSGGKLVLKNHGMSDYSPIATESFVVSNVPDIKTLHGKTLTGIGNVTISAADVGARPDTWMPTAAQVGARPSTWVPSWSQVTSKPSFATVATSGSYNDLTNKPSIPTIPSVMSTTEGTTGTATTQRTINAKNLKDIILSHSPAGARPASDVSAWAKASSKPTYTAAEVGLGNVENKSSATIRSEITASNIPNLDAGKITSGTFNTARIPNLPASKITSGTFSASRIPSLDASKISTGVLSTSRLPSTFVNLTDGVSNLPYKGSIIVYGDSDKYYPVHFAKGDQNLLRTIKIWRRYGEQGPDDWNTPTHKGSLNLEWKGNYGSWGGAVYNQWIYENTSAYTTLFAGTRLVDNSYAMAFFLRGGGTTGAIYHFASDQPLTWTDSYLTYTEPTAFYNQEKTFQNPTSSHERYAPAPRTTVDVDQINSITVVKGNDSRLTNARPASDVSSWAKASSKPTYTAAEVGARPAGNVPWAEVSGKPSSFTPSSHTHSTSNITSGTFSVSRGGTGRSTITSGAFMMGNGTSAVTMLGHNSSNRVTGTKYFAHLDLSGNLNFASDERVKNKIKKIDTSELSDIVDNVDIWNYNYINNDISKIGLMAQDLEESSGDLSDLFINTEDYNEEFELEDFKSIKQDKLVYILWGALKEEIKERQELENKLGKIMSHLGIE